MFYCLFTKYAERGENDDWEILKVAAAIIWGLYSPKHVLCVIALNMCVVKSKLQAIALQWYTQGWNIEISVPSAQEITRGEKTFVQEGENLLIGGLQLNSKSLLILNVF